MAKVQYSNGIDFISGAMNKVGKGQHSHAKILLATHRVADTTNPNCNRIYLREKTVRKSTPTTKELAQRGRFGTVAAAVQARMKDLGKITQDQLNFEAQKNTANGKRTMKAYLWSLELAAYDESHS